MLDYNNQSEHGAPAKNSMEVVSLLQSQQIEQLKVPAIIGRRMLQNGDSSRGIKFWIHPDSSKVFLVVAKDSYRLVDRVVLQCMDDFVFGEA
jgi:hypothetical protein